MNNSRAANRSLVCNDGMPSIQGKSTDMSKHYLMRVKSDIFSNLPENTRSVAQQHTYTPKLRKTKGGRSQTCLKNASTLFSENAVTSEGPAGGIKTFGLKNQQCAEDDTMNIPCKKQFHDKKPIVGARSVTSIGGAYGP